MILVSTFAGEGALLSALGFLRCKSLETSGAREVLRDAAVRRHAAADVLDAASRRVLTTRAPLRCEPVPTATTTQRLSVARSNRTVFERRLVERAPRGGSETLPGAGPRAALHRLDRALRDDAPRLAPRFAAAYSTGPTATPHDARLAVPFSHSSKKHERLFHGAATRTREQALALVDSGHDDDHHHIDCDHHPVCALVLMSTATPRSSQSNECALARQNEEARTPAERGDLSGTLLLSARPFAYSAARAALPRGRSALQRPLSPPEYHTHPHIHLRNDPGKLLLKLAHSQPALNSF